ncbi:hypothetical protein HFO87_09330 [Rhizobium leguminosarum]|uniref:hypothetical protein n=1 Tax=Rhizobium leguminosarum TaxID=384 RepID=UPI001C98BAA0|nr:hypothetical protein [Rhizobium leguminosarum]MBY5484673.1 hypothetical protein [Rhizobium leguminosarum]
MESEIHTSLIDQNIDTRLEALRVMQRNLFEVVNRHHERGLLLLRIRRDLLADNIGRAGILPPVRIDLDRLHRVASSEISAAKPFEEELREVSDEIHDLRRRKLNLDFLD